jgi:N-acetylmuramic acid 6-phosphate (MurNAc-6-P) etherase
MNTRLTLDVEELAAALADSDDHKQSEFLNTFFKALRINCGSNYNFDMQLHAINKKLNDRSLESVKFLTFEDGE